MPAIKVMNKVPDHILSKFLNDEKAYLPVAISSSPKRTPVGSGKGTPVKQKRM